MSQLYNKKKNYIAEEIRLDTLLSQRGYCSRRKVKSFLQNHRVLLEKELLQIPGRRLANLDQITVNNIPIKKANTKIYYALNKPTGYICSSYDIHGRPLALDLIPKSQNYRLYNVGRLDFDSCGLLLFTNDGDWTQHILHPKYGVEKEYLIKTQKPILKNILDQMRAGILCNRETLKICSYKLQGTYFCSITLKQGKNREIRRLFSYFDFDILLLKRVRIGNLTLGNLMNRMCRILSQKEIDFFYKKW